MRTTEWAVEVIRKSGVRRTHHGYKIKWCKVLRDAQPMSLLEAKKLADSVEHFFSPGTYYSSEAMAQIMHEANEILNDEDLRVNSDGSTVRKIWANERRILWWAEQIRKNSNVIYL